MHWDETGNGTKTHVFDAFCEGQFFIWAICELMKQLRTVEDDHPLVEERDFERRVVKLQRM